uniref:Uncharacterized protein n=1 Tax=Parascaris equorum TaxID=6256 RepID=A0A914RB44_PAREQ
MDVESDTGDNVSIDSSRPGTPARRTGSDPVATSVMTEKNESEEDYFAYELPSAIGDICF